MPTTILDNETYPEALHRRYAEESRIDRKIEIIAMAKTAGFFEFNVEGWVKEFERFAALVAAHEREGCAKLCEEIERHKWEILIQGGKLDGLSPRDCAAAIRARSNK